MQVFRERLVGFLFPAESDKWLAALRIGLGLQVVLYSLSLRSDWNYLFAAEGNGLVSRELAEAIVSIDSPFVPRLGWLVAAGSHLNLNEGTVLFLAWIFLLSAGCCLLVGLLSRPSAILAWFLHLCAVKSGGLLSYGMDNFTTIGLFYLMVGPLPDSYSLDRRIWRAPGKDRHTQGFYRRVLQLHLCLIYLFGGIAKCIGIGWWNGASLWRALTRPPFNIIPPEILVPWKHVLLFFGIMVCLLEIGYPFFIWMKSTRLIWFVCILGMHIAIGFTMGLYLFALIMIILNVAAFGPDFCLTFWKRRLPFPIKAI